MGRLGKLVFAMLVFSCPLFAQNSQKQSSTVSLLDHKIDLNLTNVSIGEVLHDITIKYEINFSYLNNEIPLEHIVSAHFSQTPLSTVLDSIFKNTNVQHYAVSKQIVLKLETPEPLILPIPAPDTIAPITQVAPDTIIVIDSIPMKEVDSVYVSTTQSKKYKRSFWNIILFQKGTSLNTGADSTEIVVISDTTVSHVGDTVVKTVKQKKVVRRSKFVRRPDPPFSKGFVLSGFITPGYSYRVLKNNGNDDEKSMRDAAEFAKFRLSGGIAIKYFFKRNWHVSTGLQLTSFGEKGSYTGYKLVQEPPIGSPKRKIDTTISYTNNYNYIGIPLLLGYKSKQKLSIGVSAGALINYLISNSTTYPEKRNPPQGPPPRVEPFFYHPELDSRTHVMKQFNFCLLLNAEVSYQISPKIGVFVGPSFCYSISNIYSSTDKVKSHPYMLGVNIGVTYSLFRK